MLIKTHTNGLEHLLCEDVINSGSLEMVNLMICWACFPIVRVQHIVLLTDSPSLSNGWTPACSISLCLACVPRLYHWIYITSRLGDCCQRMITF